jgi:hypothetical protein
MVCSFQLNIFGEGSMGSTAEFRKAFVARLKQACDQSKLVPLPGQGRQQFIADRLGVGAEAGLRALDESTRCGQRT